MNRAMFSGVAGLKTHQTKMDVIGNNIANVNTYGYKAQRAVFSDIFYQNLSSASGGTVSRGGTNPSSVGYGSKLAGVQTQMSQSSMQSTGFGMDVAITGEGFFQVMDPDGNIFYTKAGLLDYDSNGYLTDINGNFVLGSTKPDGTPDSKKIKIDDIGSVDPKSASSTQKISGIEYVLSTSSKSDKGNVGFSIGSSDLPAGQDVAATISSTGTISVKLDDKAVFSSLSDLNDKINAAIKEANGGNEHPAGKFTLTSVEADEKFKKAGSLTGEEICSADTSVHDGTFTLSTGDSLPDDTFFEGKMRILGTSSDFLKDITTNPTIKELKATYDDKNKVFIVSMKIDNPATEYKCELKENELSDKMLLKGPKGDYIEVTNPGFDYLKSKLPDGTPIKGYVGTEDITVTPAKESNNLGLGSAGFNLDGGTEGGAITLDELTSITIGSDGIISVSHPDKGTVSSGKISLANFSNPSGLNLEGSNYYSASANSGDPVLCDPGASGSGALCSNALEMSNVDLSAEFADMITTQRGFQANSRIITVSDTMLEELINLKR